MRARSQPRGWDARQARHDQAEVEVRPASSVARTPTAVRGLARPANDWPAHWDGRAHANARPPAGMVGGRRGKGRRAEAAGLPLWEGASSTPRVLSALRCTRESTRYALGSGRASAFAKVLRLGDDARRDEHDEQAIVEEGLAHRDRRRCCKRNRSNTDKRTTNQPRSDDTNKQTNERTNEHAYKRRSNRWRSACCRAVPGQTAPVCWSP